MRDTFYKLIFVTNKGDGPLEEYINLIKCCVESGVTSLQLREKESSYAHLLEFGKTLKDLSLRLQVPLIINDNIKLAQELDADGVHLGQSDCNPILAREILGKNKIIGLSVDSLEDLEIANRFPINYVGIGGIFKTRNKNNIAIHGIEGLKKFSNISMHPIVGIGGIDESNAYSVMNAGCNGIAAIGAFHNSSSPTNTTKSLVNIIQSNGISHDV